MLITKTLANLLDKLFFAAVLLLGIQLPNFVVQYQQNLSAHYQEIRTQLKQFQDIADHFFNGDMEQLLEAHRSNSVLAIRAEAELITDLIGRSEYLQNEVTALQNKTLLQQMQHLSLHLDADIAEEVAGQYSFNVPLNTEAISAGLILAFACHIVVHILLAVLLRLFRYRPHTRYDYRS